MSLVALPNSVGLTYQPASSPSGISGSLDELVLSARGHKDPAQRIAHLAAVGQARGLDRGGDERGVGVVEHDGHRLAAQLEADLPQPLGARHRDLAAGGRRPGERNLFRPRMFDENLADVTATEHHVENTRRQIGLLHQIGEELRVEHRLGRGFQHHSASGQ
jgi:hypothetical protein